ncbi:DUF6090 family protein [Algimonas porphyrae]|uniref:Uncharacterized protein n=1 Tax=Algimonas porphyrae TaxID=1128113 RepID=A0ABQ5V3X1_9PROT|nr:DUF6090 family protein [Algimonas porphyrae]GLQ21677.1 hypothetical protein GCM10007854_26320 [Algimonas porphyrae]
MILRRLSESLRRQDWITVLIEIGIVVIGLLIGLQINNWNEARADRAKEAAFLERLAVDVDRARGQLAGFVEAREDRLRTIARVENMYFGDGDIEPLGEWACRQFATMHLITHPPVAVPSITEAFAGGRIDLLTEADLIQALIVVEQSEDRLRDVIDSMRVDLPMLSQKYPEAISWRRATDFGENLDEVFASGGYQMAADCLFLKTTPEQAFLSDVVNGYQKNQWYVNFLKRHLEQLDELAAVLDGETVSNSHEGGK